MKLTNLKRFATHALFAVAASAATLLAIRAHAAGIPEKEALTYTGYLESPDGKPVTGTHSISVRFWETATASKALCAGEAGDVELVSGRFQVPLPDDCANAVKANSDLLADVQVDGASLGRTKLGAVPYAIEAGHAATADLATDAKVATSVTTLTAWQPATGVTLDTDNQTTIGAWRRIGDSIDLQISSNFTDTPTVAGSLNWTLPTGVALDAAKMERGGPYGVATVYLNDFNVQTCFCYGATSQVIHLICSKGTVSTSSPFALAKGSSITMRASFPVAGWDP